MGTATILDAVSLANRLQHKVKPKEPISPPLASFDTFFSCEKAREYTLLHLKDPFALPIAPGQQGILPRRLFLPRYVRCSVHREFSTAWLSSLSFFFTPPLLSFARGYA